MPKLYVPSSVVPYIAAILEDSPPSKSRSRIPGLNAGVCTDLYSTEGVATSLIQVVRCDREHGVMNCSIPHPRAGHIIILEVWMTLNHVDNLLNIL
jgi:hypothetical protein